MSDVFEFLDGLGIAYERYEHPAVFTAQEAHAHRPPAEFWEIKNLFLRNKKGDAHFLVTLDAEKHLDLKKFGDELGERLSFASPERLQEHLALTPGSVSPFGLLHDRENRVRFLLDEDVLKNKKIGVHPNTNTQTLIIDTKDFLRAMDSLGHTVELCSL